MIREHDMLVRQTVALWVVRADHVQQRREERQRVLVLVRREVRQPEIRLRGICGELESL